jgi:hypothetical protein
MARQIHIDSSDTLGVWIQKQNLMSDYMGDLDNFVQPILDSADSNFVTALNWLYDPKLKALLNMLDSDASFGDSIQPINANILSDSGTFHKVTITHHMWPYDIEVRDSFDSGDLIGATGIDSGWYYFDSVDSTGKVFHYRQNKRLSLKIPSWEYDLHIESGGTFRNITVDSSTNFDSVDSAYFNKIHIRNDGDSATGGWITNLISDSDAGTVTIDYLKLGSAIIMDSAHFVNVSTPLYIGDSAQIDSATITNVFVNSDFTIDSQVFRTVSPFLMTDSLGPDSAGDSGVIFFAAYKFDSV